MPYISYFIFRIYWPDGPIEARFHIEPQWDGGRKFCSRGLGHGLGHMTQMAVTPIDGKNPSKIFLLQNQRAMTLWLGM